MASCPIETSGDSPSCNPKEQKNRDEKLITPNVRETESYNTRPSVPNPNVTFEEYTFYAKLTRAEERNAAKQDARGSANVRFRFPSFLLFEHPSEPSVPDSSPPHHHHHHQHTQDILAVLNGDLAELARVKRTATWGAVFFLITTDLFGPLSVPWALSQLGYVPGTILYVLFGTLAGYTGHQIWTLFFHLDSHRHPIQSYGDLAYRIYGGWARHVANVLQSFQLFFSVGLLTLVQGQGISQLSTGSVCFAVCNLIFTVAGCIVGQIRTLQKFKWLATLSIWLNIAIMAITMAGAASYPPNYSTALAQNQVKAGPVVTSVGTPADGTLSTRIVGLMQAIYSYGGAMLYCEFMAEMKRPWDFWKAFFCAQTLIVSLYVFYGLFVYSYQGQFAVLVSNQGISLKVLQTATNAMSVASSLILACLYGNVGIKVLYMNIGEELLGLPNLHTTTRGKLLFAVLVPVYWALAFVICSAIPNITNFSALIASACVTQFTYTFPPILMLGFAA
ncbi:uncharacterized protein A1O5_00765 [Cladophialophora psammophila CBS 110553]|uniref:Amino acid transporter transmembrane domain-containing protein n=1 Tax=Cladophialophora psammophila CBS 110553 TaxID=1182543 RepID=W9X706_9EURO|nr:uncharacterized protein A1O5_00765 [Cladophialophora psammophila CBS 110553]EXJ76257.1 hypothetical protein A1O5_00765 [Cladophialophora psammophila CBS 110553]